jgi:outer membrane immunogenic protein
MRNLAFIGVLSTAVSWGPAVAADLPSLKGPPIYAPPPLFSWTGFYVGVTGGFGGGAVDGDTVLAQPPLALGGVVVWPGAASTLHSSNRTGGFVAGGGVGFNYQWPNNVVLGVESDAHWSNVSESEYENGVGFPLGTVRTVDLHIGLDWFGTTRLRLGYALDRFLPYVTGGVAYGHLSATGYQPIVGAGSQVTVGSASATRTGWTAGAGAEYAVTDKLSVKAEYLYVQFDGANGSAIAFVPPLLPAAGPSTTGTLGTHIVRAGLNWRFGGFGAGAPVNAVPLFFTVSPNRDAPPDRLTPTPAFSWTGLYVGVDGGRGGGVADADLALAQPALGPSPAAVSTLHTSNRTGGFIAGGGVGYNLQLANNVVIGVESDAQWSDVAQSQHETAATAAIAPFASARTTDLGIGLDWFGTSRLRLGYALDRFLPYVTGGVAYGEVSASGYETIQGSPPQTFASASSTTRVGWTAGAGAEFAVTERISFKIEYLYLQFGGVSGAVSALSPAPLPAFGSFSTETFGTHIVRAGLNWRFGGLPVAPIAAGY